VSEMAKCVLCEKEIGDLEESSLHQCNMLRYNKSISPPDVVEAARRSLQRFSELDGEAWKDVQAVCKWVLSHEAIDK